jgi:hypothetical protein
MTSTSERGGPTARPHVTVSTHALARFRERIGGPGATSRHLVDSFLLSRKISKKFIRKLGPALPFSKQSLENGRRFFWNKATGAVFGVTDDGDTVAIVTCLKMGAAL